MYQVFGIKNTNCAVQFFWQFNLKYLRFACKCYLKVGKLKNTVWVFLSIHAFSSVLLNGQTIYVWSWNEPMQFIFAMQFDFEVPKSSIRRWPWQLEPLKCEHIRLGVGWCLLNECYRIQYTCALWTSTWGRVRGEGYYISYNEQQFA